MLSRLLDPFRFNGRLSRAVVAAFIALNTIVAVNVLIHDRRVGYDSEDHLRYLHVLMNGRLPSAEESIEYFAPPLPYALPAALTMIGVTRPDHIEKAAQVINLAWSVLLTYFLVRLCRMIRPADWRFATWTLALLAALPVYQRTISFVRGEPMLAALAVVACERLLHAYRQRTPQAFLVAGVMIGLMMNARQASAFIVGALAAFMLLRAWSRLDTPRQFAINAALVALLAVPIGGWFYLYLETQFGSPFSYNAETQPLAISNRTPQFYWDLQWSKLFTAPVREQFAMESMLVPVLYSDTWGDYWFYFLVRGRDETGAILQGPEVLQRPEVTNLGEMTPPLARANIAGLLPSVIFGAGLIIGGLTLFTMLRRRIQSPADQVIALCALSVLATGAGYLGLLIWVPSLDVKASYVLQLYPFAVLLGALAMGVVRDRSPQAGAVLEIAMAGVVVYNLPLLFSRYSVLGGFQGLPFHLS